MLIKFTINLGLGFIHREIIYLIYYLLNNRSVKQLELIHFGMLTCFQQKSIISNVQQRKIFTNYSLFMLQLRVQLRFSVAIQTRIS